MDTREAQIPKSLGGGGEIIDEESLEKDITSFKSNLEDLEKEEGSLKENIKNLIEPYFVNPTANSKISSKALIKLLEISEATIENFKNKGLLEKNRKFNGELISFLKVGVEHNLKVFSWAAQRKLFDLSESWNLKELKEKILSNTHLVDNFLLKIRETKRALVWKNECESTKIVSHILELLAKVPNNILIDCLQKGRFGKEVLGLESSLIVGDEGGLYFFLNKAAPGSNIENIVLENIEPSFLAEKRSKGNKVILGEGSFGKVRLGLSIFGNKQIDIAQTVCIKKSHFIGALKKDKERKYCLNEIYDSTFEDFFSKKFSESIEGAPKPLDMTIITNIKVEARHRKGYLIMELFPKNTADIVMGNPMYQKWEYQRPFIIEVCEAMKTLLRKRVFNSDLKPANLLFDPLSRKVAIIDLGSSLAIESGDDIKNFDISVGGFGKTDSYCPPEIMEALKESNIANPTFINLWKAISYLCGVTVAEVTSDLSSKERTKDFDSWKIGQTTNLDVSARDRFSKSVKGLLKSEAKDRINLDDFIDEMKKIGTNESEKRLSQESFIEKIRRMIKINPSLLNLNLDINEVSKKGIIEQRVVEHNPRKRKFQTQESLNKEINEFFNKETEKMYLLLGEAGSGKSLAVQLNFIQEVKKWKFGDAIPIYFNLANETKLQSVVSKMNANLGSNFKLEKDQKYHLFIDSYDEGAHNENTEGMKTKTETKKQMARRSIFNEYLNILGPQNTKILATCRTDFFEMMEAQNKLSEFLIEGSLTITRTRFIAPIGYGSNEKEEFKGIVERWLQTEGAKRNVEDIMTLIKILDLEEKMKSGMMFHLILKILSKHHQEPIKHFPNSLTTNKMKVFHIYRLTIRQEFKENLEKILGIGILAEQREREIRHILLTLLAKANRAPKELNKNNYFEVLCEGFELVGVLIAEEMSRTNKNRINYYDLEKIIKQNEQNAENSLFQDEMRLEWSPYYQIFRIMGLKLERSAKILENSLKFSTVMQTEEDIKVGFRHETYKSYYLLKKLKSISRGEILCLNDIEKFLKSVIDNRGTLKNFELLRFFGEEIKYGDGSLSNYLFKLLEEEKITPNEKNEKEHMFQDSNGKRAAILVSLLVAGDVSFSGRDLSHLNLKKAYMRGGNFHGAKFSKTNLSNSNMTHALISNAVFDKSDLTGIETGLFSDFIGHKSWVISLCWSRDGTKLASGEHYYLTTEEINIRIWNALQGECIQILKSHNFQVTSLCFSPNGESLVSAGCSERGSASEMKIWDIPSGTCVAHINYPERANMFSVFWTEDGKKILSANREGCIDIWDSKNGARLKTIKRIQTLESKDPFGIHICEWAPKSERLIFGSFELLEYWDFKQDKPIWMLKPGEGFLSAISLSSSETKIATIIDKGGIGYVAIRNIQDGKSIIKIEIKVNNCKKACICWSPDEKLIAAGSAKNRLKIYDWVNANCILTLDGHSENINCVSWCPNGQIIASGSSDNFVKLWNITMGESVQSFEGHKNYLKAVSLSSKSTYILSGGGDEIKICNTSIKSTFTTINTKNQSVKLLSWNQDGSRFASGGNDGKVRIWDSISTDCLQQFNFLVDDSSQFIMNKLIKCLSWHPDGKKIAVGGHKSINILDTITGNLLYNLKINCLVICLSWDKAGQRIAFAPDLASDQSTKYWLRYGTVEIKDVWKNTDISSLECKRSVKKALDWSPDSKHIATGESRHCRDRLLGLFKDIDEDPHYKVKIWESETGNCVKVLQGHTKPIQNLIWIPNSSEIATGSKDGTIKIWNAQTTECIYTLYASATKVIGLSISTDGKMIASASADQSIKLWEKISEKKEWILRLNQRGIEGSFLCNGSKFLNCQFDKNKDSDLALRNLLKQNSSLWVE